MEITKRRSWWKGKDNCWHPTLETNRDDTQVALKKRNTDREDREYYQEREDGELPGLGATRFLISIGFEEGFLRGCTFRLHFLFTIFLKGVAACLIIRSSG